MRTGFHVNIHYACAKIFHVFDVAFRLNGHKMYVKRFPGYVCNGLHNGKAERYVGNKNSVHYIKVHPIGTAAVQHLDIAGKIAEIGSK